ncbi:hypothetical protein E6C27_scaffold908G00820 [Cucumis melo var. makuwa]|uniref:Uncharacterized protein n=1 Tax=Cucumis melo var. makuwa TaxID=1194695 RepID=A0A5A7TWK8_CUCMM|nr:hypothetical protein E6C27_scaffold908G00820 [Cucumis melo var. makuwa]
MGVLRDHHYYDTDMMERPDGATSTYDRFDGTAHSPSVLGIPLEITKDQLVPTGAHVARVRDVPVQGVEAEVGTRASWRVTRSDRGGP